MTRRGEPRLRATTPAEIGRDFPLFAWSPCATPWARLRWAAGIALGVTGDASAGVFMPQLIASAEGIEVERVYLIKDRTTLGRKPHNDIV